PPPMTAVSVSTVASSGGQGTAALPSCQTRAAMSSAIGDYSSHVIAQLHPAGNKAHFDGFGGDVHGFKAGLEPHMAGILARRDHAYQAIVVGHRNGAGISDDPSHDMLFMIDGGENFLIPAAAALRHPFDADP